MLFRSILSRLKEVLLTSQFPKEEASNFYATCRSRGMTHKQTLDSLLPLCEFTPKEAEPDFVPDETYYALLVTQENTRKASKDIKNKLDATPEQIAKAEKARDDAINALVNYSKL